MNFVVMFNIVGNTFAKSASLSARVVPFSGYPKIGELINRWQEMASHACKTITDPSLIKRLSDSQDVCRFVGMFLRTTCEIDTHREVYICVDSRNMPQAVMTLSHEDNNIHVHHLVTCPWNICLIDGTKDFQVKGAGTLLMKEVFKKAVEQLKSIDLDSYGLSLTFYEKFGFVLKVNKRRLSEDDQVVSMIIPANLARLLYSQYIPRCIA